MVDAAHAEGWQANCAGYAKSSNPYAAASAHYRLADVLTQAWQLGWVRAEMARELSEQHAALQRHLRLVGSAPRT